MDFDEQKHEQTIESWWFLSTVQEFYIIFFQTSQGLEGYRLDKYLHHSDLTIFGDFQHLGQAEVIPERLDVKDPSLARFGGTEDRRGCWGLGHVMLSQNWEHQMCEIDGVWKHIQHLMVWTEKTQMVSVSMALRVFSCFHWTMPEPFWVPVGSDQVCSGWPVRYISCIPCCVELPTFG